MNIYPYTPYFYIIKHKETGRKYAGCRYGKCKTSFSRNGCHPIEFLKEGGYKTSSEIIKTLLKSEGLDSFEILEIITLDEIRNLPFCHDYTVLEYEHFFLIHNNCLKSKDWFNAGLYGKNEITRDSYKKAVDVRMAKGSYKSGVAKAVETKRLDIVDGRNCSERAAAKTVFARKNTILESGKTVEQESAAKRIETLNSIDEETGLTRFKVIGLKIKESSHKIVESTGLQIRYHRLKIREIKYKSINPETGKTYAEEAGEKISKTRISEGTSAGAKNPRALKINIFDADGNLKFECHGNIAKVAEENNLPPAICSYNKPPLYLNPGSNLSRIIAAGFYKYKGWYSRLVD